MDFNFGAHDNGMDDLMSANFDYHSDKEMEPTTEPQTQPEQQQDQAPEQETLPDTQLETQPEAQPDSQLDHQPSPSGELIPSIERTASVDEPSQEPAANNEVETSPSRVKSEDHDSMDFTHDNPPNGEQHHRPSLPRTPAVEEPVSTPEDPKAESVPSTASPQPGQPSSPTSLTPQIASASIFGGPLPKLAPTSKPAPSIFGGQPTPSIFGGPVQKPSTPKAAQPPQLDDDDFDFMVIDSREASVAAQQKWSSKSPPDSQDDVVFVKEERRDDVHLTSAPPPVHKPTPPVRMPAPPRKQLDPAKIMAAQRAMLQRNKVQNNGEGSSRGHMRPTQPVHFDHFEDNAFGISDQVDAVMRDVNEDNSWMDEEDDNDLEYEKWLKLKNQLVRKQRAKTITADESLHLYKVTQKIAAKERMRAAASRKDDEEPEEDPDSLFLPETREETVRRRRREQRRRLAEDRRRQAESEDVDSNPEDNAGGDGEYNDDDAMAGIMAEEDTPEAEPDLGLTKAGKPRKRRAKVAKGPKEYMDRQDEKRREKERAKAQKKKGRQPAAAPASRRKVKSPVTRGRGRTKANDKGKGKEKEKEKPVKKGRKGKGLVTNGQSLLASGKFRSFNNDDPVGHMILEDLMNNDPISDRLQNPIFNRPAEETISGNQTKTTQFQLLFANIPEPEDALTRGAVRSDKAKLRDASKSFGYAKCKAKDGKWLIKGMKSTLYHHQLLGAQWMVQRELSSQPPHGGLLADSMGLGKTVQTLACMVGNPPGPGKLTPFFCFEIDSRKNDWWTVTDTLQRTINAKSRQLSLLVPPQSSSNGSKRSICTSTKRSSQKSSITKPLPKFPSRSSKTPISSSRPITKS